MTDWTTGPDGRANTSSEYHRLVDFVAKIIQSQALVLGQDGVQGAGYSVAGLIMAQLAHDQDLTPGGDSFSDEPELKDLRRDLQEAKTALEGIRGHHANLRATVCGALAISPDASQDAIALEIKRLAARLMDTLKQCDEATKRANDLKTETRQAKTAICSALELPPTVELTEILSKIIAAQGYTNDIARANQSMRAERERLMVLGVDLTAQRAAIARALGVADRQDLILQAINSAIGHAGLVNHKHATWRKALAATLEVVDDEDAISRAVEALSLHGGDYKKRGFKMIEWRDEIAEALGAPGKSHAQIFGQIKSLRWAVKTLGERVREQAHTIRKFQHAHDDITLQPDLDKLGVGTPHQYTSDDHVFQFVKLTETGFHTDRFRFCVICLTCNVVLHEATTGPLERVGQHLFDVRTKVEINDNEIVQAALDSKAPQESSS